MNEFLKFAYEMIAQVVYNLTYWVIAIVNGFIKFFITGWGEYIAIFNSYFRFLPWYGKILAVLLCVILIGIPAALIKRPDRT